MTIIFFLIAVLILWFIFIIKKENDEREKHIKHSIRNLRKFVKTYNDKSDYYRTLVRIARENRSNNYSLSQEDMEFKRKFIKEYIFDRKEFCACYKEKLSNGSTLRCNEFLEESCKDFFYDNIITNVFYPYRLTDELKLEYINYLFFKAFNIFVHNPKNAKEIKPYIDSFIKENTDTDFFLCYYIYYPKKKLMHILKDKDINDSKAKEIKNASELKYITIYVGDNLCYDCFKDIYKDFLDDIEHRINNKPAFELNKVKAEYIDKDKFLNKNNNKRKGKRRMLRYLKCYKMKTDNNRFRRIAKRTFFDCYKNLSKV